MYLREMGSVELLSREGEIAIAKRIEAGRETMIAGLCESPLTFQAIIIWRDELNEAKILLRDIIDLEATYAGPEAKQARPIVVRGRPRPRSPKPRRAARRSRDDDDITNVGGEAPRRRGRRRRRGRGEPVARGDGSRAEAAGDGDARRIADTYKKLRKLQDQQVENRLARAGTLSPSQERRYKEAQGRAHRP
jgi:RNA polymerase primary sigma factor